MIKKYLTIFFVIFSVFVRAQDYDVVVYGGTSAGIAAAIQSSRMGKSVVLIEPTSRIGGLTTGGLGATDIGNKKAIGGISYEFYRNIKLYYDDPANWKYETKEEYFARYQGRNTEGDSTMWTFEPSAALKVYEKMIAEESIDLVYNERLNRLDGVILADGAIQLIEMESGRTFNGKVFIDATYEGDLMAATGVSYTVGRESNDQYWENLNGVQANRVSRSLTGRISRNARFHNFVDGVDPYVIKDDPASGLLPGINTDGPGDPGSGDEKVQAYCFRMTLTDDPGNRIPFKKPENYNELNYELLFRNYGMAVGGDLTRMYDYGDSIIPWINTPMPNRKTDINNQKGFSTNFIGQNYNYPDGTYEEREAIVKRHRDHQQGLMWTLAYHPRIPEIVRNEVSRWGTCKDEYEREDGWQQQLYIREARRMISSYVMSQRDCEGLKVVNDPIGLGAYTMDSHMVQRYVDEHGYVQNEGNVACSVPKPYSISYRAIVPKKEECSNLVVPVCVSSSHIAFGSIRMEPVFMVLGQSAATVAAMAIEQSVTVQNVPYEDLKKKLISDGQILE